MIKRATKTITAETDVIEALFCDTCGTKIPFVFENPEKQYAQGLGMLTINICGGYGEFLDGSGTVQLCKDCAAAALKALPVLKLAYDNSDFCI